MFNKKDTVDKELRRVLYNAGILSHEETPWVSFKTKVLYGELDDLKDMRTDRLQGEIKSLQKDFNALLEYMKVEFKDEGRKLVKKTK